MSSQLGTHKTAKTSANTRQSRPDYGLGFQAKVLGTINTVPSSLGSCPLNYNADLLGREALEDRDARVDDEGVAA